MTNNLNLHCTKFLVALKGGKIGVMAVYILDVDFVSLYKSVVEKNRRSIEYINNFIDIVYIITIIVYVAGTIFFKAFMIQWLIPIVLWFIVIITLRLEKIKIIEKLPDSFIYIGDYSDTLKEVGIKNEVAFIRDFNTEYKRYNMMVDSINRLGTGTKLGVSLNKYIYDSLMLKYKGIEL